MSRTAAKSDSPALGPRIRAWRTHLGLKQGELEDRAGLCHNTVSRIENGLVSPKVDTIERLAAAMGMSVEEMQFKQPAVPERQSAGDLALLLRRLADKPEASQRHLLRVFIEIIDIMDGIED